MRRRLRSTSTSGDFRPERAYTPRVASADGTQTEPGDSLTRLRARRRARPSRTEQQRREAWGHEWGQVGAAWKRRHANEGK